jgi:RNA polymerase-binding protein DksA
MGVAARAMEKRKGFYSVAKKVSPRKSATGKAGKASAGGSSRAGRKTVGKPAAKPVAKGTKGAKSARTSGAKNPAKVAKVAKPAKSPAKPARSPAKPTKVAKSGNSARQTPAKSPPAGKPSRTDRPPLTREELKEFRQLLFAKRRELVGDMTGIEAEALGADRQESKGDISDHPADAGTDNFEQEFSLGLLESERNLLADIDKALIRLEKGTYGVCLGTGRPIAKARLMARPWAPYGIEYARMVEKGLVRAGDRIATDEESEEEEEEAESEAEADGEVERDDEPEDREADHEDEETGYGE